MNVLELLQAYLQRAQAGDGTVFDRIAMRGPPATSQQDMPSLQELMQQQRAWEARNQSPAYGEGEIMAPQQWWNPATDPEKHLFDQPQRNENLVSDLGDVRDILKNSTQAVREGSYLSGRPEGVSPFASPLNQLLQRGPFALY
jgi:hypothetical protein